MRIEGGCRDTRKAPRKNSVYVDVHQRVSRENEKSRWRAHKEQETRTEEERMVKAGRRGKIASEDGEREEKEGLEHSAAYPPPRQ